MTMQAYCRKNIFVTGVESGTSLAWQTVEMLLQRGVGRVILSVYPSERRYAQAKELIAQLPEDLRPKFTIIGLDVNDRDQIDGLAARVTEILGNGEGIDGVLHSIARLHPRAMGNGRQFMEASWDDLDPGFKTSAFSYKELLRGLEPVLNLRFSAIALSFNSQQPQAGYGWTGVLKGALEAIAQHLAEYFGRELEGQVNVVSAGVYLSAAASKIPGFGQLADTYARRRVVADRDGYDLGRTVTTLLVGDLPGVTGETIYADGGVAHASIL
ncbi:MAG: SDR family oxidoreductase [Candidatus Saccharimonas sp.]